MPNVPSDRRLEYWRHVARAAEQDLHHLRDGILEAIEEADAGRGDGASCNLILDRLITELVRLASQPSDRRQRAQDAFNAVNEHTTQEKS